MSRLYEKKEHSVETIVLPPAQGYQGLALGQAIERRRSVRRFSETPLSLEELSILLRYSAGITDPTYELRAAPSAGALYPLELYLVLHNVAGLPRGVYRYLPQEHSLEKVREGDLREEMVRSGRGQRFLGRCNLAVALVAVWERILRRYGERGRQYTFLEAGHIAQNISLVAASLGLGACAIGAYSDDEVNRLLGRDGAQEAVVYVMAVGKT